MRAPITTFESAAPRRQFRATALPHGDPDFGVPGPLLQLIELAMTGDGGQEIKRLRVMHPEEAAQLIVTLGSALHDLAAFNPGHDPKTLDQCALCGAVG